MRRLLPFLALAFVTPAAAQRPSATPAAPTPKQNPLFAKSAIRDWTTPPKPTKEPVFRPPTPKRLRLANGMALLVVENKALPILSMSILVPGAGVAADPAGKGGLAAFTADLLDEGAGGLSALAIAAELDRLGATFGVGAGADASAVYVSTLSKTLEPTLDLVAKIVTQPAFDDAEVARVKGDRVTSLELRRDRPREVAQIVLAAALYGRGTPYGHPAAGVLPDFKALTAADARAFYQERWNPSAMTIIVAGDVDAAALKTKLDARLGGWKVRGAKRPAPPQATPATVASRLLLVDRPAAAQSDVRVGLVGPARKDRRYYQFEVFRTVFGDGFTSRLTQRLREQLGIVYNAGAGMEYRLAPGPFVIAAAIVTAETGRGLGEIIKMVEDLGTTDVPPEELDKAKQNMIRALPARFETNVDTVNALVELVIHGLPDNWYAGYAANVRRVTAKDVRAIAKSVVPSNKLVFSVVGDLTKVRADLDKLGLGEPALHDPSGVPLTK